MARDREIFVMLYGEPAGISPRSFERRAVGRQALCDVQFNGQLHDIGPAHKCPPSDGCCTTRNVLVETT